MRRLGSNTPGPRDPQPPGRPPVRTPSTGAKGWGLAARCRIAAPAPAWNTPTPLSGDASAKRHPRSSPADVNEHEVASRKAHFERLRAAS